MFFFLHQNVYNYDMFLKIPPSSQRLLQDVMCCWLNSILVMLKAAQSLEGPLERSFSFSLLPRSFRLEERLAVIRSSSDRGS